MKHLLLLIFSLTIWSCSNKTVDNSNSVDTSATKDSLIAQTDINKIQINANFPFGCTDLTKLKYPKYWEGDLVNYGQLKKPKGKEFDDIGQCFDAINLAKTITPPMLKALKLLKIGDNFKDAYYLDTILQKSIDSCRYRLPNIGIYECYYSYQQNRKPNSFGLYGNLLLLDPKTKNGKLLNIYSQLSGDSHIKLRYFFIDKNIINIYEGSCYDDGISLNETFKIIVNPEGEISIDQIKK